MKNILKELLILALMLLFCGCCKMPFDPCHMDNVPTCTQSKLEFSIEFTEATKGVKVQDLVFTCDSITKSSKNINIPYSTSILTDTIVGHQYNIMINFGVTKVPVNEQLILNLYVTNTTGKQILDSWMIDTIGNYAKACGYTIR